jgi:hypothetical protein
MVAHLLQTVSAVVFGVVGAGFCCACCESVVDGVFAIT